MTEDETVGWYHQINGHEFEQSPGDSVGQGSLAYYSPLGQHRHDLTTEQEQFIKTSIINRTQGSK